ncbi:MAG: RNA polymerase sigma factor, partial [Blastocatellia bacterium]
CLPNQERKLKTDAWPIIEETYTDEFGEIDPETLTAAGQLWLKARSRALSILGDEQDCYTLLMKACAEVTRKRADDSAAIKNLRAYLSKTWRRLLLHELEKRNGHRRREEEMTEPQPLAPDSDPDALDNKILIQQIFNRADELTGRIFEYRLQGFTFPEIGEKLGLNPDVLRATFNDRFKKLMKQLTPED